MKAVQISSFGGYDQLQLVEMPQPVPETGQVVVKMTAAAINPLDHHKRMSIIPWARNLPLASPYQFGKNIR